MSTCEGFLALLDHSASVRLCRAPCGMPTAFRYMLFQNLGEALPRVCIARQSLAVISVDAGPESHRHSARGAAEPRSFLTTRGSCG